MELQIPRLHSDDKGGLGSPMNNLLVAERIAANNIGLGFMEPPGPSDALLMNKRGGADKTADPSASVTMTRGEEGYFPEKQ